MRTIVYLPFCMDYIHIGHINILNEARKLSPDNIIIGLVTDERMDEYKDRHHTYEQRRMLALALKGVSHVLKEDTKPLFIETIRYMKPEYVIHGDDWNSPYAPLGGVRLLIIDELKKYGGKLIEPAYTEGVNSTCIRSRNQHSKV